MVGKFPTEREFVMGFVSINGGCSIAMFDYLWGDSQPLRDGISWSLIPSKMAT